MWDVSVTRCSLVCTVFVCARLRVRMRVCVFRAVAFIIVLCFAGIV